MNYKKILVINLIVIIGLLLGVIVFLFITNTTKNQQRLDKNILDEKSTTKLYINNDYRDNNTKTNTYLGSLTPMVVYSDRKNSGISINAVPFREAGEFIGLTFEGKEIVLDIPKVDLFRVSNIAFDKASDAVYLIESRYDSSLKTQVGTLKKIDIKNKKISTLADSIIGGIEYVEDKILAVNEYGVADEAIVQLYDTNTGEPLQPRSYVKSNIHQTEYRIVINDAVYQIVFDNYGGMKTEIVLKLDGLHKISFPISSDSLKVHFNKIGTLNKTYLANQKIPATDYLRSVYDDQKNTAIYYTQTTGDIWPKGVTAPKLTLFPTNPVLNEDYYQTYYAMGNLYDIGDGKYTQVIGDGLVIFDIDDMSVKLNRNKNEITNILLNKKLVAPVVNYIESAGTPAACGDLIGSTFEYPRVLEGRRNSWFAYCLR